MASGQIRDVGCSNPQAEERQTGPQECVGFVARKMSRAERALQGLLKRAAILDVEIKTIVKAMEREREDAEVAAIVARELGEEE